MAEPRNTASPASASAGRAINWAELAPVNVAFEDAMGPEQVAACWERMMSYAGLKQPDEKTRAAFRLGVYVYGVKNGTSREGNYAGEIKLSTGVTVEASVIPRATGKMMIRKFFRGCMEESYVSLKVSRAIEQDERMVSRAAALGINASSAFAMADWMTDCPMFTPEERAAHLAAFNYSVSRARRARGGKDLNRVESDRVDETLAVQGSLRPESDHYAAF